MKVTEYILDDISSVFDISGVTVSTEQTNWKGEKYSSDLIVLDEKSNIGLEVFDKEIIVFYFREHVHYYYEDGMSEFQLADWAIELLTQIFTCETKYIQVYKGNKLLKETFYFLVDGKWERECTTNYSLVTFINPFTKKMVKESTWKYEKQ